MGRPTTRKKSPIARAIAELRQRLGETQQSMAIRLGVSLQSVARWETESVPHYLTMQRLWMLAREHGHKDLMKVFQARLDNLTGPDLRKLQENSAQLSRWSQIRQAVTDVMQVAEHLNMEGHPMGQRLKGLAENLSSLTRAAQEWSWGYL
jgi:transcriptional regulator with XRE-family HTH domain